jgi:hypothetical protein
VRFTGTAKDKREHSLGNVLTGERCKLLTDGPMMLMMSLAAAWMSSEADWSQTKVPPFTGWIRCEEVSKVRRNSGRLICEYYEYVQTR